MRVICDVCKACFTWKNIFFTEGTHSNITNPGPHHTYTQTYQTNNQPNTTQHLTSPHTQSYHHFTSHYRNTFIYHELFKHFLADVKKIQASRHGQMVLLTICVHFDCTQVRCAAIVFVDDDTVLASSLLCRSYLYRITV